MKKRCNGYIKNKTGEIILNVTVIYTDDVKEQFKALRITEKGVIIGLILEGKFVYCGFISKRNVNDIWNNNAH